jgi:FkbM family methyltransferase
MLGPGRLMLDIGGWIGPTTLYAAGLGAGVTVFEPDPKAHAKLARNIARNPELAGRVTVVQAALNSHNGSARLYSNQLRNSMSGLINGPGKHARQSTDVRSIDGRDPWIEELVATADLVKIDIEGGEFMLIPWIAAMLQRHRPTLYLSLHAFFLPGYMDKADRQRRLLAALGFYDYVYRAVEGEWIRLSSPWDTLAAEAETSGLQGSLLLSMEPVAGLNAEREAAAEI